MKKLFALALVASLVAAPAAFATEVSGGLIVGGYAGTVAGNTASQHVSYANGTSSSDAAGGGQAGSSVVGTGTSKHYNTGYDASHAESSAQVGAGYANTATSGGNTAYNYSSGKNTGSGTGTSDGQAGGDYSSKANGAFGSTYVKNDASQYVGGVLVIGGAAYAGYKNYGL